MGFPLLEPPQPDAANTASPTSAVIRNFLMSAG
jgi:hypothetical protein